MKTKVICALIMGVVAGFTITACNSGRSSENNDAVVKVSADNPNNPYDYYGQMHNEAIIRLIRSGAALNTDNKLRKVPLPETYTVFNRVLSDFGFIPKTRLGEEPELTDEEIAAINANISSIMADATNGFLNYIGSLDLDLATKEELTALFNGVINLPETSVDDIIEYVVDFENSYIAKSPARNETKDRVVLGSASVMAHSALLWSEIAAMPDTIEDETFIQDPSLIPHIARWWEVVIIVGADAAGAVVGGGAGAVVASLAVALALDVVVSTSENGASIIF